MGRAAQYDTHNRPVSGQSASRAFIGGRDDADPVLHHPRESAPSPRRTRARRARRRALFLDACASMGVVVMTLTFTLRVLAL